LSYETNYAINEIMARFEKEIKKNIDTPNYKIIIPKETGKTAADIANLVGNYGQTEN